MNTETPDERAQRFMLLARSFNFSFQQIADAEGLSASRVGKIVREYEKTHSIEKPRYEEPIPPRYGPVPGAKKKSPPTVPTYKTTVHVRYKETREIAFLMDLYGVSIRDLTESLEPVRIALRKRRLDPENYVFGFG